MADNKKTKKLLNEKSYRRMQVFAGLITEAQAEQMDEADAAGSDDINDDVVKESEELSVPTPKDDPLYKDAKGTDKLAKNQKGGPSKELKSVPKPTFNLKEENEFPPGLDSQSPEQLPDDGLGDDELGDSDKLTVDADEFSNDLALGLSQALQKHFGNKISVTADGSSPASELPPAPGGDEEGFEDVSLEDDLGGEEEGLGEMPPDQNFAPKTPDSAPLPQDSEEERKQFESKKSKLMESMVNKIMSQILKGSKK